MEIIVCVKQTFDSEEKIVMKDGSIAEDDVKYVMNPYDEYAVEEAIRQKEQHGGNVTVITVGPDRTESVLRTALAMGADQAVRIWDEQLADADEYVLSQVLAAAIRRNHFDLILAGYMAIDSGAGQGGPRLAEELDIAHAAAAVKLSIQGRQAVVERDAEGDVEVIEAALPLLVTAQQGLNEPRYPSLPGIMKAKRKPIERLNCSDLGIKPDQLANRTVVVEQMLPPARKAGQMLSGTVAEMAGELISKLKSEDKVI